VKTLNAALQTHLDGSLTKLATCILLTRTDAAAFGFTTHDQPLVIGAVTYEPAASFNPTDIASKNNLDTDNVEAEALLDSSTLTEDDLRAGRWDFAAFRIFQVNWSDLSMGDKKDRAGHLAQVTVNRQTFVAELLGLMESYTISIGEITSPGCRANLGDARCTVALGPFTVTGTIDSAGTDLFSLTDAARTEAAGYFAEGVIAFTSGTLNGLAYEIKSFSAGVLVTKTPLAYDATGCNYTLHAGCDKKRTTCRDRFANVVNFRGEPWLRGVDAAVQIGRHS
jgi:uncharacterized phage protein (TIGR02218 family)